jgi:hypothetical protein
VSFTQLDQYLRCPARYRFLYIDHVEPDFVPAARAFGSGIHAAAAYFFRGVAQGEPPEVEDVQGHFEALWNRETQAQPLRYGEKETKESLRDLGMRVLAVLHREFDPGTRVVAVEEPFRVPLVDVDTGEVLDRDLVGTIDLLERDAERRLNARQAGSLSLATGAGVERLLDGWIPADTIGVSPDGCRVAFAYAVEVGSAERIGPGRRGPSVDEWFDSSSEE